MGALRIMTGYAYGSSIKGLLNHDRYFFLKESIVNPFSEALTSQPCNTNTNQPNGRKGSRCCAVSTPHDQGDRCTDVPLSYVLTTVCQLTPNASTIVVKSSEYRAAILVLRSPPCTSNAECLCAPADHFFDGDAENEVVYESVCKPIIQSSMEGIIGNAARVAGGCCLIRCSRRRNHGIRPDWDWQDIHHVVGD